MKRTDYEEYVKQQCKDYVTEPYLIIAINEEAGEIAGFYKKYVLRGNPTGKLGLNDLKGEIGDCLFYLTRLAQMNGWSLDAIMEHNVAKLDERRAKGMRSIV